MRTRVSLLLRDGGGSGGADSHRGDGSAQQQHVHHGRLHAGGVTAVLALPSARSAHESNVSTSHRGADANTRQAVAASRQPYLLSAGRDGCVCAWSLPPAPHGGYRKTIQHSVANNPTNSPNTLATPSATATSLYTRTDVDDVVASRVSSRAQPLVQRYSLQLHAQWINAMTWCGVSSTAGADLEPCDLVATASADRCIYLQQLPPTGAATTLAATRPQPVLVGRHKDYAKCLAFAPGAGALYSGGLDGVVSEWDVAMGLASTELSASHGFNVPDSSSENCSVYCLATPPSGSVLLTGHPNKMVNVIDPRLMDTNSQIGVSGKSPVVASLIGHKGSIKSVFVTGSGTTALSSSSDGTAKLWSLRMPKVPLFTYSDFSGASVSNVSIPTTLQPFSGYHTIWNDDKPPEIFFASTTDGYIYRTTSDPNTLSATNETVVDAGTTFAHTTSGIAKVGHSIISMCTRYGKRLDDDDTSLEVSIDKSNDTEAVINWKDVPLMVFAGTEEFLGVFDGKAPPPVITNDNSRVKGDEVPEAGDKDVTTDDTTKCEEKSTTPPPVANLISYAKSVCFPIRARMLNDQLKALVLYSDGSVCLWDVSRAQKLETYPSVIDDGDKQDSILRGLIRLDKAENYFKSLWQKLQTFESVATWCTLEPSYSGLLVHLSDTTASLTEVYYDYVDPKNVAEERINVGRWVLANVYRKILTQIEEVLNTWTPETVAPLISKYKSLLEGAESDPGSSLAVYSSTTIRDDATCDKSGGDVIDNAIYVSGDEQIASPTLSTSDSVDNENVKSTSLLPVPSDARRNRSNSYSAMDSTCAKNRKQSRNAVVDEHSGGMFHKLRSRVSRLSNSGGSDGKMAKSGPISEDADKHPSTTTSTIFSTKITNLFSDSRRNRSSSKANAEILYALSIGSEIAKNIRTVLEDGPKIDYPSDMIILVEVTECIDAACYTDALITTFGTFFLPLEIMTSIVTGYSNVFMTRSPALEALVKEESLVIFSKSFVPTLNFNSMWNFPLVEIPNINIYIPRWILNWILHSAIPSLPTKISFYFRPYTFSADSCPKFPAYFHMKPGKSQISRILDYSELQRQDESRVPQNEICLAAHNRCCGHLRAIYDEHDAVQDSSEQHRKSSASGLLNSISTFLGKRDKAGAHSGDETVSTGGANRVRALSSSGSLRSASDDKSISGRTDFSEGSHKSEAYGGGLPYECRCVCTCTQSKHAHGVVNGDQQEEPAKTCVSITKATLPPLPSKHDKLTSSRMLRLRKLCSYFRERATSAQLKPCTVTPNGLFTTRNQASASLQFEKCDKLQANLIPDEFEMALVCRDTILDPEMTLAITKLFVWKENFDSSHMFGVASKGGYSGGGALTNSQSVTSFAVSGLSNSKSIESSLHEVSKTYSSRLHSLTGPPTNEMEIGYALLPTKETSSKWMALRTSQQNAVKDNEEPIPCRCMCCCCRLQRGVVPLRRVSFPVRQALYSDR